MIYRITEKADWIQAQATGQFASRDLAREGFIHLSQRGQVQQTADKHYASGRDLLLLAVDEARLTSPWRCENTGGGTQLFPHVYGPIPLEAVVAWAPLIRDDAGQIRWPKDWVWDGDPASRPV